MAAVFDDNSDTAYSGFGTNPFDAYYVDASAGAFPGETGYNETDTGFTHSVFVEKSDVTWCSESTQALYSLWHYYELRPFWFAVLVWDQDTTAQNYLNEYYNAEFFPTGYYDGGYRVLLGNRPISEWADSIYASGARPVPKLYMSITPTWLAKAGLEINVRISSSDISYTCGDADASEAVDIDDVVYLINFIFAGGPEPDPYESGDADCSGAVDIDDAVYLINFIFAGGHDPCDPNGDLVPDC
jgi:hypothetical protein